MEEQIPRITFSKIKGKIKNQANPVRNTLDDKPEEDRKEAARKIVRNKEQKKEQQESSQGGSGRSTGTVRKERRSSIKDLIRNFNDITKGGDKVTKERMNRNRNTVEVVESDEHVGGVNTSSRKKVNRDRNTMMTVVEHEVRSPALKRKASEMEEGRLTGMNCSSSNKKTRIPATAAKEPESARDTTILKYLNYTNILYRKESTGGEIDPAQTAGPDSDGVDHPQGVGEVFLSGENSDTADAPAKSDVKQLPR